MAAYTFPANKENDVRAAIGLGVTDIDVPNALINLSIYKGVAEKWIMRQLTAEQYEDVDAVDEVNIAAIYYIASLITPKLRIVESERIIGGSLTYAKTNLMDLAEKLEQEAVNKISDVQAITGGGNAGGKSDNPNLMTVGRPRRTCW